MANKQIELNQIVVNRAKPGDCLVDSKCTGLQLEVTPKGIRTWFHRFRFEGKQPRIKIGSFPSMGLAEARAVVTSQRAALERGEAPTSKRALAGDADMDVSKWTLERLMESHIEHASGGWNDRSGTGAEIRARMRNHVYPFIRPTTKAANLTLEQILSALTPLAKKSPSQFKKVSKDLRAIINHMTLISPSLRNNVLRIDKGELSQYFKTQVANHAEQSYAYVPVESAAAFFAHFQRVMNDNPVRRALAPEALLFVMLTAARTGEVIGHKPKPGKPERVTQPMTWREVDFNSAVWIIPGSRTKNGYDHIIPLSTAALNLLRRVKLKIPATGPDDFVFPSHIPGTDGWMSNNALMSQVKKGPTYNIIQRKKNKASVLVNRHPTVHGLRTTFTTFAVKAGFSPELVSMSIAHKIAHSLKDTSFENYWASQMVEERRALMESWADYCTTAKRPKGWKNEISDSVARLFKSSGLEIQHAA